MKMLSPAGLALIKSFEGLRTKAYKAAPQEKYYTIGYGHYGADVRAGQIISPLQAEAMLSADTMKAQQAVNKYDAIYRFTQNEFDALVSFAFNIGNIDQLTKQGTRSKAEIADKMLAYNKCGGKVLAGLKRRREAERNLFLNV